jgi:hypothetical protein
MLEVEVETSLVIRLQPSKRKHESMDNRYPEPLNFEAAFGYGGRQNRRREEPLRGKAGIACKKASTGSILGVGGQ